MRTARELKGLFTKIQKRWQLNTTRKARGGKSQKGVERVLEGGAERRWEE